MTTYNLILFLHVLSVFGIIVSFGLEGSALNRLQRSCTREDTRELLEEFGVLPWIGGPSFLIALISGIYLWETAWRSSAWTVVALIALVVLAGVGAALTGPRMAALGGGAEESGAFQSLQMPVLWASFEVRAWMVIGIAFLMSVKPGAAGSVIVVLVSILLGLAMNPVTMGYYRRRNLCALYRHQG